MASGGWGWAVGLGAAGYVAGLLLLCFRGLPADGGGTKARRAAMLWYILLALASLVLWAAGLLFGAR